MDEEYDIIVLGTGLKECILSGLMSIERKKVLHMDRNNYYGGATASISPIGDLFKHFGKEQNISHLGKERSWNVDLIPKFLMVNGKLVKLLVHTGVTRYMEFQSVEGSFVYQDNIYKVPSSSNEAFTSSLLSLFDKNKFRKFLNWVISVDIEDPKAVDSVYPANNPMTTASIGVAYEYFSLNAKIQRFVGHSICLYTNDDYITQQPAIDAIRRMKLYYESVGRFGKSPYVYPLYGLGELPQGFARLSAVYGGTYMLDKPVDEIVFENGKVVGVRSGDETAKCKTIICDPSYAMDRVKKTGQVVRAICILDHPVKNVSNVGSGQIIIPQNEFNRGHDIYVSFQSSAHNVCAPGYFIALVATTVETNNPEEELQPGLKLLDNILHKFVSIDDVYVPNDDGLDSQLFISSSYDATSHFESTCTDVLSLYERITGHPFDFSKVTKHLGDTDE